MKELRMDNGDVRDSDVRICRNCSQPGASYYGADGEWYHPDCRPEGV